VLTGRSRYGTIGSGMHVVSHKAIRVFSERRPDAKEPLDRWYRVAKCAVWANFADAKQSFNTADLVAPHIIFDNKYRLVTEINFRRKVLFIRHVMTHKEYEKGGWK
jgi:mRNA interferase HigB